MAVAEELARDEDGVPCRVCQPAHGTITALLQCRCAGQCGAGDVCTGIPSDLTTVKTCPKL